MRTLITLARYTILPHLLPIYNSLGYPVLDDESAIRRAAEECCTEIGIYVPSVELLDILIPRARGLVTGTDTAHQRKLLCAYYKKECVLNIV